MPVRKVQGGFQWGGKGKVYPTREGAARQARAAYANGYVGKSLVEIRKSLSQDDRKSLATGVGATTTAAGLGGAGVFIVRAKGHRKMLNNQIASEKLYAGTPTTHVNHYLRGEGAGKIAPEKHILRHLKRGRAATLGLAGGGAALTAYGLRRKPVEKADRDRGRSRDLAAVGGGATLAGGGYGLARVLEHQGNKWSRRAEKKIEAAQSLAPQMGGWAEGPTRTKVRHVQPTLSNKDIPKNPQLLHRMTAERIEEIGHLRGAAGQHRHFGKIYGDIGRQFRRYAVPAGAAIGAAGAVDLARRKRRDRLSKAMSEEKKKSTATGVGAVGIGAGLLGGGIPGVKADASAGKRLFPHLSHQQKPKAKDLLHPGPVMPRVKAAAEMGRGGIFGYRTDAHQRFLDQQVADDIKYGNNRTTHGNHYRRGMGTGKVGPERKIIRHMKAGRAASYGLLGGGIGLTAYGRSKKKPVEKADEQQRRGGALIAAGGSTAGLGYGASRLLEHQGRRWAAQSARDIEAAQRIVPELGGWTEGSRKNKRVPNIKPDLSNREAETRRRTISRGHSRTRVQEAGRLRGRAAQGRYFSGVYGVNANRVRRVAVPAGLAMAGVGAVRARKPVEKAYNPRYFGGSVPTERLEAQRERTKTELEHQAARGAAVGLGSASSAALATRWLGHDRAPGAIKTVGHYARMKGVPKETVKDVSERALKLGAWAKPRRGRLLVGAGALSAGSTAAGALARWKKDENTGISQDLGRAASGDRLAHRSARVTKSVATAVGAEYGLKAAQKWADLPKQTRTNLIRGGIAGGTVGATGGGLIWSGNRERQWKKQNKALRAGGGIEKSLVMKSESVGFGKSNVREFEYLPENIRQEVGEGSIGTRRNPMSALDLFASSRIMAEASARANGERVSGKRLSRRTRNEMAYAGSRAMLYSPVGRGSVF